MSSRLAKDRALPSWALLFAALVSCFAWSCTAELGDEHVGESTQAHRNQGDGRGIMLCRRDGDCPAGYFCADGERDDDRDRNRPGQFWDRAGFCKAKVDDGNPCTKDDTDALGRPRHIPVPVGTSCSDGNVCNGSEACDASGQCRPGAPPSIDDQNPCTADSCSPSQGVTHKPVGKGTSCSNDNACDGHEKCDAGGRCLPGKSLELDDGNPCTADSCDPETGVRHKRVATGTSCADSNLCNGNETCDAAGQCKPGKALNPDDKNPCTEDRCDRATGVSHTPVTAGTSCADADHCNGEERCGPEGACVVTKPTAIDDGNPCTADACDAKGGVSHTPLPVGTSCDDGDVCNGVSTCAAGAVCKAGAVPVVDDQNPCTVDQCTPVTGITHVPVGAGTSCADADACNGSEVCSGVGVCEPGMPPVVDDQNVCTVDSCDANAGVIHEPVPLGTPCGDADACNGVEICDGRGLCVPGPPTVVDDANPCTVDGCDPVYGIQHVPVEAGTSCDDGDACDGEERCDGSGLCQPGEPPVLDDENRCTLDRCDPESGVSHDPAPEGTACGDGDPCNGEELCDGAGTCGSGGVVHPDDGNPCTEERCSSSGGVQRVNLPEGTGCGNDDPCDGDERCDAYGVCVVVVPPPLDDGNPCTIDRCDANGGVTHEAAPAGTSCSDAESCDGNEVCDGEGSCIAGSDPILDDHNPCTIDTCHPTRGVLHEPVPAGTSCADADLCNGEERCSADGRCVANAPSTADDGNPCTIDACDLSNGTTHTPVPSGTSCDDGNPCNGMSRCDASGACTAGPGPIVDDGNPCTEDSCDPGLGVVHNRLAAGTSCRDANACNGEETCSATGVCAPGVPPALDDGNGCTADSCDPTTGVRHEPLPTGASCADDNACDGSETCNGTGSCVDGVPLQLDDANPCTEDGCDPASGVSHTPLPFSSSCGDGDACNGDELCDETGVCRPGSALPIDDQNPCTTDSCDPTQGVHHEYAAEGTECPDSNACNGVELCDGGGVCVPNAAFDIISLNAPSPGTLTRDPTVTLAGTVRVSSPALITVSPSGASLSVDGSTAPLPFAIPVALAEGDNAFTVSVAAEDGCSASAGVVVTRDSAAPAITFDAPDSITLATPVQVTVTVTDPHQIAEVRFSVSVHGAVVHDQARSVAPFVFELTAPSGAGAGDVLQLEARATDQAGNQASVTRTTVIAADALVAGRVLSDATGHPLAGASVQLGDQVTTVRSDGRYALGTADTNAVVRAWLRGHTGVERRTPVTFGTGSIAVDARLTPLAEPVLVSGDDVTFATELGRGGAQPIEGALTVFAEAFDGPTAVHFTPLSPQGLPGLLPLGWSPIAGFELRVAARDLDAPEINPDAAFPPLNRDLSLALAGLPAGPLAFVAYDRAAHGWRSYANLDPIGGIASATLARLGAYAIVVPDSTNGPPVATPGTVLAGVASVDLPPGLSARGASFPDSLPASDGLAEGRIVVPDASSLPSGTMIGAAVTEEYPLSTDGTASVDTALQDLVLYRAQVPSVPGIDPNAADALGVRFPIKPSYSFDADELGRGNIHVDVIGGREAHRGRIGGLGEVEIDAAGVILRVSAGSLEADTLIDVERPAVDAFVPRTPDLDPLAQLAIDFVGATLTTSAELTVHDLAVADGQTPLLARLERVHGVARPHVVAVGLPEAGSWTFTAGDGLPGLVKDGTYVVYGSTLPLGFVAGTTRAAGAPVQAFVTVAGLPFIAAAASDGTYKIPALPGQAVLDAFVPDINLAAHATIGVTLGETSPQDFDLIGAVTAATVTPVNGAVAVDRTTQIQLEIPVALDPATATLDNIRLFTGAPGDATLIPRRLQLSANAKSLAVIPETRLDPATTYTLQASGLRDKLGGIVVVPVTTFKTAADVPPVVNTDPVTVSLPGDGGNAVVSIPPGTFPPGTTVIITNEANGIVTSCSVGNAGGVDCEIPATSDDTLVISITDPEGNTTTIRRGQYQLPDGRTAVGPGGGVVKGPGGVELRIPEGALSQGVTFKVTLVDPGTLSDGPNFPGAISPVALKLETQGNPFFRKEIDLAFPKPNDAPEGAYYYVFRRLEPSARSPGYSAAIYEVIDHAFPEGGGGSARVVTASCPFPGVRDALGFIGDAYGAYSYAQSIGAISQSLHGAGLAGLADVRDDVLGVIFDAVGIPTPDDILLQSAIFVLAYTYDQIAPSTPSPGLVRGRVIQPRLGAGNPEFEGVLGAMVTGFDAAGRPYTSDPASVVSPPTGVQQSPIVAVTREDGTYTLWDPFPTEGAVKIRAALPPHSVFQPCPSSNGPDDVVRCVQAVQEVVAHCANNVRLYKNQVKANVTFPAAGALPSLGALDIRLLRVVGDRREPIAGIATQGDSLVAIFESRDADVRSASLAFQGLTKDLVVQRDLSSSVSASAWMTEFAAGEPGTYSLSAAAHPASGASITKSVAFRVVAPGGDITEPVSNAAPEILAGYTTPKNGAMNVHPAIHPHVVFSEPVRNVPNSVALSVTSPPGALVPWCSSGLVDVALTGIDRDRRPVSLSGDSGSQQIVTSLTVQPKRRLKFGCNYSLAVGNGVFDLDDSIPGSGSSPRSLVPYSTSFATLLPHVLQDNADAGFSSPGIAVLNDRAYVIDNGYTTGQLRVFDVSDPLQPTEIAEAQRQILGRPMDLDVQDDGQGGATVVVVTGPADVSLPSNLRVYYVPRHGSSAWTAASTLASTATEGIVRRVISKGSYAYTIATNKGVQVVDLDFSKMLFEQGGGDTSRIRVPFNTDQQGFGHEAVVATIPVPKANGRPAFLSDLQVAELPDGLTQPIVVATGEPGFGLVLINPQTAEVLFPTAASGPFADPIRGQAIAVTRLAERTIAAVAGHYATGPGLLTVDVSDPRTPFVLGQVALDAEPVDAIFDGELLLLGSASTVTAVDVSEPTLPTVSGVVPHIGGRLSLGEPNLFFGAMPSTFGGQVSLGGIRAATQGLLPTVLPIPAIPAARIVSGAVSEFVTRAETAIQLRVFGASLDITEARVRVLATDGRAGDETVLRDQIVPLQPAAGYLGGALAVPSGWRVPADQRITVVASVAPGGVGAPIESAPRLLPIGAKLDAETDRESAWADGHDEFEVGALLVDGLGIGRPNEAVTVIRASDVELKIDPNFQCGSDCVLSNDAGELRFSATSKIVGHQELQLEDSLGNRDTVDVDFQPRKVVVLARGILTSLACTGCACSPDSPDFDALRGILAAKQFVFGGETAEQVIWYSYRGGHVDSETGRWCPNSYSPSDTAQAHAISIQSLYFLLDRFSHAHPNTEFYLVGHSQGGLIMFQGLGAAPFLAETTSLGGIVTLDAPLGGAPASHVRVSKIVRGWRGPANDDMVSLWETTTGGEKNAQGSLATFQATRLGLADCFGQTCSNSEAIDSNPGTTVRTVGNVDDGLYSPEACGLEVGVSDNSSSQVVHPQGLQVLGGNESRVVPPVGLVDAQLVFEAWGNPGLLAAIAPTIVHRFGRAADCIPQSHGHVFGVAVPQAMGVIGDQYQ
jgi:hypothetical protein